MGRHFSTAVQKHEAPPGGGWNQGGALCGENRRSGGGRALGDEQRRTPRESRWMPGSCTCVGRSQALFVVHFLVLPRALNILDCMWLSSR